MNVCPHCGAPAAPDSSYCPSCGGVLHEAANPAALRQAPISVATAAMAGRTCPYCRFPLKEGSAIQPCGVCQAIHHADCWRDNGGCAVGGCSGGPSHASRPHPLTAPAMAPTGPPPPAPPTPLLAPPPPPPMPPPPMPPPPMPPVDAGGPTAPRPGVRVPVALIVVLVLVVGGLGAGAAILLSSSKGGGPASHASPAAAATTTGETAATSTATTETAPGGATQSTSTESNSTAGLLPNESREQMQPEIQHLLYEWHEDVVNGDYRAAWNLLSERKQQQNTEKYGYSEWVKNQATLGPYLNPSGIHAAIVSTEPASGVATVNITGMKWNKPGASCTEWSGITWVKYETGAWRYDPGYSTTPEREAEWKSRFSELLGGRC